jgi:hypothetical protein
MKLYCRPAMQIMYKIVLVESFLSFQVNITHYFCIDKANQILNYDPKLTTKAEWNRILEPLRSKEFTKIKNLENRSLTTRNSLTKKLSLLVNLSK